MTAINPESLIDDDSVQVCNNASGSSAVESAEYVMQTSINVPGVSQDGISCSGVQSLANDIAGALAGVNEDSVASWISEGTESTDTAPVSVVTMQVPVSPDSDLGTVYVAIEGVLGQP